MPIDQDATPHEPPATAEAIEVATFQFVRKISGYCQPSKANRAVFGAAIAKIAAVTGTCWTT